jgi:poly(3-hydroxybutyrate) depolymerase
MVATQLATQLLLASNIISSAISAGSKGCGKDLPAAQTPPGGASHQTDFTQSDGTHRTYLIHIPSNYDKNTPVPLIFSFPGRGKNSSEQEGLSQFSNGDCNPNGIAVYPQGIHVYLPLAPPVLPSTLANNPPERMARRPL